MCVSLLYYGMPMEEEDVEWWRMQRAALDSSGVIGGTIEITTRSSYIKLMSKSTHMTLERALRKYDDWLSYYARTIDRFETHGIPKAATMLNKVVSRIAKMAKKSDALKLEHLRGYFFDDFPFVAAGLELPSQVCEVRRYHVHLVPSTNI